MIKSVFVNIMSFCVLILAFNVAIADTPTEPLGKILYIGDSHSVNQTFAHELKSLLTADGSAVNYNASCGSNASHWLNGGYKSNCGSTLDRTVRLSELQSNSRPDKVVINLGDNLFSWKGRSPRRAIDIPTSSINDMKKLVATITDDKPCYWVGPTRGSRGTTYFKSDDMVNRMYELLKETVGERCTIVDCREAVPRNSKGDGLHHHNEAASKAWAQCINDNLRSPPVTNASEATVIN